MTIVTTMIGSTSGGGLLPPPDGPPPAFSISFPTISRSVPQSGNSNVRRYVAWYSFELTDTTDVNVNTIGSGSGGLDTEVGLYDSDGNLLGYDDDSGGSGWSTLTRTGLGAGIYYVAVGLYNIDFDNNWYALGENSDSEINQIKLTVQVAA